MKLRDLLTFSKITGQQTIADRISTLSAALAYYALFSLAPLFTIILAIATWVFGERAAKGQLLSQLQGTIGTPAAQAVEKLLAQTSHSPAPIIATIIGTIMLILGAMGIFGHIRESFEMIWENPRTTKSINSTSIKSSHNTSKKSDASQKEGMLKMVKDNLVSFLILLTVGFLFLVFMLANTLIAAFIGSAQHWFPLAPLLINIANFLVPLAISTLLLAILYKYLTDKNWHWKEVWLGAFMASLLFNIGKILLNFYLTHTATASQYGAAGSIIVILLWLYYSAHILFVGAEVIKVAAGKAKERA